MICCPNCGYGYTRSEIRKLSGVWKQGFECRECGRKLMKSYNGWEILYVPLALLYCLLLMQFIALPNLGNVAAFAVLYVLLEILIRRNLILVKVPERDPTAVRTVASDIKAIRGFFRQRWPIIVIGLGMIGLVYLLVSLAKYATLVS
jgi:hypothetical protein